MDKVDVGIALMAITAVLQAITVWQNRRRE
ncbi:membrane protein [Gordonia phage Crater]|nr:membrane protein [Gordonia phage Crater]